MEKKIITISREYGSGGRQIGLTAAKKLGMEFYHLERMLSERGLRAAQENEGQAHFYVSDVPDSFVQTADLFLGEYKGGPVEQIAIDKY